MKINYSVRKLVYQHVADTECDNEIWVKKMDRNKSGNFWYKFKDNTPASWDITDQVGTGKGKRFKPIEYEDKLYYKRRTI